MDSQDEASGSERSALERPSQGRSSDRVARKRPAHQQSFPGSLLGFPGLGQTLGGWLSPWKPSSSAGVGRRRGVGRGLALGAGLGVLLLLPLLFIGQGGMGRRVRMPFGEQGLNSLYSESYPRVAGRYLSVVSDRRGRQAVELFDLQVRSLLPLPGLNRLDTMVHEAAVSENGRWIVFTAMRQGRSGVFIYQRDSQQVRELARNLQGEFRRPSISSDGGAIAFEVGLNGQWDVAVYDRFGRPLPIPTNP